MQLPAPFAIIAAKWGKINNKMIPAMQAKIARGSVSIEIIMIVISNDLYKKGDKIMAIGNK
ncbi:hypothetical protein J2TS4_00980 [Paenibacillus sp. J2TS4]|nr:hypothetical protein J2TS4_00980 [Paenibacillus sp. J2TS4]